MNTASQTYAAAQGQTTRRIVKIAVAAGIALILASLLGRIMSYELRRDEFMFVPPAALLGEYDLYRDLFFNQPPYSAWLFRAAHVLMPGLGLLAAARVAVFLSWLFLLGSASWIGWRLTRSGLVALFAPASLLLTEILLGQTGMAATNNLLPLAFALLGLGLFAIAIAEERLDARILFLSGVMLAIAPGFKVSAFAFIPPVALGCFLVPRSLPVRDRLRRVVLPVGLGGLIGALPLIWLALTRTSLFFAHIGGYHTGPHVAYWRDNAASEPDLALGLAAKIQLSFSVWFAGAAMLSVFIAVLAGAAARRNRIGGPQDWTRDAALVIAAATICAAAFAFLPTPGFPQYYAPPLIGLPVLTALYYRALPIGARAAMRGAIGVALILMVVIGAPRLALGLSALRDPGDFTASRIRHDAAALSHAVTEAGLPGDGYVATLSPLYPLEAGMKIYPQLSAGLFGYRVAPYTEAELAEHFAITGPAGLPDLLDAQPPVAVLTGFDPGLDDALIRYAETRGYVRQDFTEINDRYGEATLWLPPVSVAEGENP